jgi:hypothetical protein
LSAKTNAQNSERFGDLDLIFLPGIFSASWVHPSQCVWDGPTWFDNLHRLSGFTEYRGLEELFHNILQVPNAGVGHFLDNIVATKTNLGQARAFTGLQQEMLLTKLYDKLGTYSDSDSACDNIRYVMDNYCGHL